MKVKNLNIINWCPDCTKPKAVSYSTIIGGSYEADDPAVVEMPELCHCTTFPAATTSHLSSGSYFTSSSLTYPHGLFGLPKPEGLRIEDGNPAATTGDVPFNSTQLRQIEGMMRNVFAEEFAKVQREMARFVQIDLTRQLRMQSGMGREAPAE